MLKVENLIFSEQREDIRLASSVSLVVHLHVFYPDLMPEVMKRMERIPVPFTLLVSVPDGARVEDEDVEKTFRALSNVQEIKIKHTPNRGRDIAPMLCSFAEEIQQHEVLLHLHTKKSPHHKEELEGWLTFILEHLLPSRAGVTAILSRLQSDAGMVIPPDFVFRSLEDDSWGVPQNIVVAQEVADRAGLNVCLRKEFPSIVFPQGGMLWARTDYLKRLFDMSLRYEDFPEEPIGVDGTIAHALERLYCLWGKDSGKVVCRANLSDSDVRMIQYFAKKYLYFKEKNKKHLRICRILIGVCLLLILLLVLVLVL